MKYRKIVGILGLFHEDPRNKIKLGLVEWFGNFICKPHYYLPLEAVAFERISERWIRAALQLKSEAFA